MTSYNKQTNQQSSNSKQGYSSTSSAAERTRAGGLSTNSVKNIKGDSMNTLVTTNRCDYDDYEEWLENAWKEWAEMKYKAYRLRVKYTKRKQLTPNKRRITFYG